MCFRRENKEPFSVQESIFEAVDSLLSRNRELEVSIWTICKCVPIVNACKLLHIGSVHFIFFMSTWFEFGSSPKKKKFELGSCKMERILWILDPPYKCFIMRENLRLNSDSVRAGGTAKRRAGRCAESLLTHPQQSDREAEAGGRQEKFNQWGGGAGYWVSQSGRQEMFHWRESA